MSIEQGLFRATEDEQNSHSDEVEAEYLEYQRLENAGERAYEEYWSVSPEYPADDSPNYNIEPTMKYEHPDMEDDHCIMGQAVAIGKPWKSQISKVHCQSDTIKNYQYRARYVPIGRNENMDENVADGPEALTESDNHHLQDFPTISIATLISLARENSELEGLSEAIERASKNKTSRRIRVGEIYFSEIKTAS